MELVGSPYDGQPLHDGASPLGSPRTNQEAQIMLDELYQKQSESEDRRLDWLEANWALEEVYPLSAATSPASWRPRIENLEVPEPEPALEDFLPSDYYRHGRHQALELYSEICRNFVTSKNGYPERERNRLTALERARDELKRLEAEERTAQLARQRQMWPEAVELDQEIAGIEGIVNQINEYNKTLDRRIMQLETILAANIVCLPSLKESATSAVDVPSKVEEALFSLSLSLEGHLGCSIPFSVRVGFTTESRQVVVEQELPTVAIVPRAKSFRYNKSREQVIETTRPHSQIKALYAGTIHQLALLTLSCIFAHCAEADVVVFNGVVDTLDPRTGQPIRPCLITVRVTREAFDDINLRRVDPAACLKHLSASVSKSPIELAPVKPVFEISMVDPRFVSETDAISSLDDLPNLLEMRPTDFEALIQNLFTKMGLEARQTRPSRDGGVDCIAYDTRPIFGGKIVIQAKRYKNTVGVSAVRDLYGTLQNEGASKGILVTTSGYGQASFEFANNKPIELIEGSHLLYLLEQYAGLRARIVPPDNWRDPVPDSPSLNE